MKSEGRSHTQSTSAGLWMSGCSQCLGRCRARWCALRLTACASFTGMSSSTSGETPFTTTLTPRNILGALRYHPTVALSVLANSARLVVAAVGHAPTVSFTFVSTGLYSLIDCVLWQAVRDQRHVGGVYKFLHVLDRSSHSHVHHFDVQGVQYCLLDQACIFRHCPCFALLVVRSFSSSQR